MIGLAEIRAEDTIYEGLIGRSTAMRDVVDQIRLVAQTESTVLIGGGIDPQPHRDFMEVFCDPAIHHCDGALERAEEDAELTTKSLTRSDRRFYRPTRGLGYRSGFVLESENIPICGGSASQSPWAEEGRTSVSTHPKKSAPCLQESVGTGPRLIRRVVSRRSQYCVAGSSWPRQDRMWASMANPQCVKCPRR
jgi:hypothetical protein